MPEENNNKPSQDPLTILMKRYNNLYFMRKLFDKKAKEFQAKMDKMQKTIEDLMLEREMPKVSLNNGVTTSLEEKIWSKVEPKNQEKAVELLKAAGLGHLVLGERVNHQSLSAYMRECKRNNEPLPKEWDGVIEENPTTKLIPRRL